jgi:hypothetical protein
VVSLTIDDQTVTAYTALQELRFLYDAYRASSRAHVMVLQRIESGLGDRRMTGEERNRTRLELIRHASLASETDAVFAIRAEQVRRRLLELRDLPVPP